MLVLQGGIQNSAVEETSHSSTTAFFGITFHTYEHPHY